MAVSLFFKKPTHLDAWVFKQVIGNLTIYKLPNKAYKPTSKLIFTEIDTGKIIDFDADYMLTDVDFDTLEIRSRKITKGSPIPSSQCEQKITFNAWIYDQDLLKK